VEPQAGRRQVQVTAQRTKLDFAHAMQWLVDEGYPEEKAQYIIAEAARLLSTSDEEGFSNTFLEAWSSGTPVISLKLDPDHIIERQELGTAPGTVERAIADIMALMDAPQQRDAIAVRARRYVAETHSEAAVAMLFERAVAGICS
jgi:glycosyltransferase involved in cell wall biosynthesis